MSASKVEIRMSSGSCVVNPSTVIVDGVEQKFVRRLTLDMEAGGVAKLTIQHNAQVSATGTAEVQHVNICAECKRAMTSKTDAERATIAYAAYWRITSGLSGDGWRNAWFALEGQEKAAWIAAVQSV